MTVIGRPFLHNRLGKRITDSEANAFSDVKVTPQNGSMVGFSGGSRGGPYQRLGIYLDNKVYCTAGEDDTKVEEYAYDEATCKIIHTDNVPQEIRMKPEHMNTCLYDFGGTEIDRYVIP